MNPSKPDPANSDHAPECDSRDSVILIDDGPGDNTVRPASRERLQWFAKERERLAKLGFNLDGTLIQSPDDTAAK